MSGENSKVKAAYLMPETTFGVCPDTSGAAAFFIPAEIDDGVFAKDERAIIQRTYMTGRNKHPPTKLGKGKGSIQLKPYAQGYSTSVGTAGSAPSARQWFDYLLESVLGTAQSHNAAAVSAGSTTSSLVTATSTLAIGDLAPVRGPTVNGGNTQWSRSASAASPYTMSPLFPAAPAAADVLYAGRTYYPKVSTNATSAIGATLSVVIDIDGTQYLISGARPSALSLKGSAGDPVMWDVTLEGDTRVQQAFSSLPAASATDPDPMLLRLNSIMLNGVAYDIATFELNFGLTVEEVKASSGNNGRSGWRVTGVHPTLKIDPLNSLAFETLFSVNSTFEVLLQIGDGGLSNGHINTMAIHFPLAQFMAPPAEANDGGIIRKSLMLAPVDAGASTFYFGLGIA